MVNPALLLLLGWLAAGCSLFTPDPNFPNAPEEVRSRPTLPSCGRETNVHGAGADVAARTCFWDGYQARRPAEFISTVTTIEGDPVTFIYRILPDGRIEVFVDSTQDRFGSRTWARLDCTRLEPILGAQVQPAFGPGDCRETALP